ncbi:TPA: PQ-loop domain-containing transporter [Legionella feeleii]
MALVSFTQFVDLVFSLGLFFNAALFIPQAIAVFRNKSAMGLSLLTFGGFNIMQLFTAIHGYLAKDYLLMTGFLLSFLTCGVVTVFILYYGNKNRLPSHTTW